MCLLLIEPSDEDDAHSRGSPTPPPVRIALSARTPTQWGRFVDYFRDAHVVMRFRRITLMEIRFF